MNLTNKEKDALIYFARSSQAPEFIGILKKILTQYSDVRNLKEITTEEVRGAQIASHIIEKEIIERLQMIKNGDSGKEITEEYE